MLSLGVHPKVASEMLGHSTIAVTLDLYTHVTETMVTPVPRRRPQQLGQEIATLDRLSEGRMILGVGLGAPIENEYARFGEPTDLKVLAGMLRRGAGSDDVAVVG